MALGGSAVIGALLPFGVLLALNLAGAQGMPGVVLHGWGALAALALLLASAAALLALWLGRPWLGGTVARALHLVAAAFGVMGLLALGLSYILLPMFALAPVPAQRQQLAAGATALLALALGLAAAVAAPLPLLPPLLRAAAAATGGLALAWHLVLMRRVLATGMRRDLGRSLRLMQLGWACAALALLLALAMAVAAMHGAPVAAQGRALGVLLLVGWLLLLSFLLGVLQRVLPFLASLHAARGQRRPPTPSALTLDRALAWHARAHAAALVLLLAAAFAGHPWLVAAAAAVGLAGALAFALFFGVLLRRLAAPPAA